VYVTVSATASRSVPASTAVEASSGLTTTVPGPARRSRP
jgi:hypothetical protein